jgi:hypothetical protein
LFESIVSLFLSIFSWIAVICFSICVILSVYNHAQFSLDKRVFSASSSSFSFFSFLLLSVKDIFDIHQFVI